MAIFFVPHRCGRNSCLVCEYTPSPLFVSEQWGFFKKGVFMAREILFRRGTAQQNDAFVGKQGEVTMDTTNNILRVHDGITLGGTKTLKADDVKNIGLPSKKYVNLTLGATGASYVAPANGFVSLIYPATDYKQFITVYTRNPFIRSSSYSSLQTGWCTVFLPVNKGDEFIVEYSTAGTLQCFRFYYNNGNQ